MLRLPFTPPRTHPANDADDMNEPNEDALPRVHLLLAALFIIITIAAGLDLLMDRPTTLWSVHVLAEATVVLVSLSAAAYLAWGWYQASKEVQTLEAAVQERQAERDAWREQASQALRGLSEAMSTQFDSWELTPAERQTALMLLQGFSHKRIAKLTDRSERTARQHAVAVYRKSGLSGRSELSAFFLEGLLLPVEGASREEPA